MSKLTLHDFNNAGIDQFVRDLSTPMQDSWDSSTRKENVAFFTPVQYVQPPLRCPFPFDDKIKGEHLEFPSKEEWLECPEEKKYALFHQSIDDFESYRLDYNERVDKYYEKEGLTDLVEQIKSGVSKYERGLSHFEFQTINHRFHFDQVNKDSHNKWKSDMGIHWRHVDNEAVYYAILDLDDEDAVVVINKTVYDYIRLVTKDRELKEGDLYYNPMRELHRWAESESIDFDDCYNIFTLKKLDKPYGGETITVSGSNALDVDLNQSPYNEPEDWTIIHDMDKKLLNFEIYHRHTRQTLKANRIPYEFAGFNTYKTGVMPRKVELLERYAIWQDMIRDSPNSPSLTWEEVIIIKDRKYTLKLQRELAKALREYLVIDEDVEMFRLMTEDVGSKSFNYWIPKFKIKTVHNVKYSHKELKKGIQKELKSNIENFHKAKKMGTDDVYHTSIDDSDLPK